MSAVEGAERSGYLHLGPDQIGRTVTEASTPPTDFPDSTTWWNFTCNGHTKTMPVTFMLAVIQYTLRGDTCPVCETGACYSASACTVFHNCHTANKQNLWDTYSEFIDRVNACCKAHPDGGTAWADCVDSAIDYYNYTLGEDSLAAQLDRLIACCPACNN